MNTLRKVQEITNTFFVSVCFKKFPLTFLLLRLLNNVVLNGWLKNAWFRVMNFKSGCCWKRKMSVVANSCKRRPLWLNDYDGSLSFSELFSDQRGQVDNDCRPRTKSAASAYTICRNRLIHQRQQSFQPRKNGLVIQTSRPIPIPGRQHCLTPDEPPSSLFESFISVSPKLR